VISVRKRADAEINTSQCTSSPSTFSTLS
jgi:hypothetical protein